MSKTTKPPHGWSTDTYATHVALLRAADMRFENERDRRYTEVNIEKEKALKIKETADLAALQLARESQSLKELQNDALRDKTLSESGVYATNAGVAQAISDLKTSLQPLVDYVSAHKGAELTKGNLYAGAAGIAAALGILYYFTKPGG